jgi:hypothetical protein
MCESAVLEAPTGQHICVCPWPPDFEIHVNVWSEQLARNAERCFKRASISCAQATALFDSISSI